MTTEEATGKMIQAEQPRAWIATESSISEVGFGHVQIETMHFDHTSELTHVIKVYDARHAKGGDGWGKVVFKGTIEDLINLLS